jgi:hypothetical protein
MVLVGALLLLGALGAFLLGGAERGEFADALSTWRAGPTGARAVFLLAQDLGLPVARRTQDLRLLEGTHGVVLLGVDMAGAAPSVDVTAAVEAAGEADGGEADGGEADGGEADVTPAADGGSPAADAGADGGVAADGAVAPGTGEADEDRNGLNLVLAEAVTEEERGALLAHVERGATLVYAPRRGGPDPLLEALGVHARPLPDAERRGGPRGLVPPSVTAVTHGVTRVEAPLLATLDFSSGFLPLLVEEEGQERVVAAQVTWGEGYVIVLGAPALASNAMLGRADNARLWANLVAYAAVRGPVQFDEYHHGFRNERSVVDFARRYGLHLALAQLLAGLALWAASLRRFGPPRPFVEETRSGGAEALSATARLYRAGRHHAFAAGLLVRELSQSLARTAGVAPHAPVPEVEAGLRARGRADLAEALSETAALARTAAGDADVVATATRAAQARRRAEPPLPSPPADDAKERTP